MFLFSKVSKVEYVELNIVQNTELRWTILVTLNYAFLDFFYNWLWHFDKLSLRNNIIVIAEDKQAFHELQNITRDNIRVWLSRKSDSNSKAALNFNSYQFLQLMRERPGHILAALQESTYVLFNDVDTVWKSNPLPYLHLNDSVESYDILAQMDGGGFCAGFLAFRKTNRTLEFIKEWGTRLRLKRGKNDQMIFNELASEGFAATRIKGLDSAYFPDGQKYFQKYSSEQRRNVVVVHNNFILSHDSKLQRFEKFGLWNL
ncbi:uncharacterized protein LOC128246064 [Mya arenaria]|uniref:uncharacterized protein LOC128246064 n=1 Tax=Mya arenaria TaxID=6604 RepID=UPI0022E1E1EC|nr:uncharacterized protein LOC128246064 [Mya arenaria]